MRFLSLILFILVTFSSCVTVNISSYNNYVAEPQVFNGVVEFLDGKYQGQTAYVSMYNVPTSFLTNPQPIRIKQADFVAYKGKFN